MEVVDFPKNDKDNAAQIFKDIADSAFMMFTSFRDAGFSDEQAFILVQRFSGFESA